MKNADYIIDMGPGGGKDGGRIVASGTIDKIKNNNERVLQVNIYKKIEVQCELLFLSC